MRAELRVMEWVKNKAGVTLSNMNNQRVKSYKDLIVWRKSMNLVKRVYSLDLPKSEQFGLASQINRASVSIPSNIAEGSRRGTAKEYKQFCRIARGSAAEVETQLIIIAELYNIDTTGLQELTIELQKMLTTLIKKLD